MEKKSAEPKYSRTISEVVEMLKKFQEEHGDGGYAKMENQDWKDGYAHAVSDILWMIL